MFFPDQGSSSTESFLEDEDDFDNSWLAAFLSSPENVYFCHVPAEWADDPFNLVGIDKILANMGYPSGSMDEALDVILGTENLVSSSELHNIATLVYELIHQRFIVSQQGLNLMRTKFNAFEFGTCPRLRCCGQPLLPYGESPYPGVAELSLYCAACNELYRPPSSGSQILDGCGFGPTFAHLFLLSYEVKVVDVSEAPHVPRVFGFQLATKDEYETALANERAGGAPAGAAGAAGRAAAASAAPAVSGAAAAASPQGVFGSRGVPVSVGGRGRGRGGAAGGRGPFDAMTSDVSDVPVGLPGKEGGPPLWHALSKAADGQEAAAQQQAPAGGKQSAATPVSDATDGAAAAAAAAAASAAIGSDGGDACLASPPPLEAVGAGGDVNDDVNDGADAGDVHVGVM